MSPHMDAWEPRAGICAALRAAGPIGDPARQILLAELALRLARQGHFSEVRIHVAGGTPYEAIRSALAELALAQEAAQEAQETGRKGKAETALGGEDGAQGEKGPAVPGETIPGGDNRSRGEGTDAVQDRVLAILAEGPSHTRALAAQLHRRVAVVLAALHGLEQAGRAVRSHKKGRGTRWNLGATPALLEVPVHVHDEMH